MCFFPERKAAAKTGNAARDSAMPVSVFINEDMKRIIRDWAREAMGHTSIQTTESYPDSFRKEVKKEFAFKLSAFKLPDRVLKKDWQTVLIKPCTIKYIRNTQRTHSSEG